MRAIGLAERVLSLAIQRSLTRRTFGQELARHGTVQKVGGGERQIRERCCYVA